MSAFVSVRTELNIWCYRRAPFFVLLIRLFEDRLGDVDTAPDNEFSL